MIIIDNEVLLDFGSHKQIPETNYNQSDNDDPEDHFKCGAESPGNKDDDSKDDEQPNPGFHLCFINVEISFSLFHT